MNLMIQTIIIAYLFFIVPFHFGILWTGIFVKKQKEVSEILTKGFLFMMAVFCMVAVIAIRGGWALSELTKIWIIISMLNSAVVSIFFRKKIQRFVDEVIVFWKKRQNKILGWLAVLIVCSIAFTRPGAADATLEILQTAVSTNTMYLYDAYTGYGLEHIAAEHAYAPVEMLYAVGGSLTAMELPLMLYYLIPIGLLVFFYMGIWNLGNQLIKNKKYCIHFIWIVVAIYWMTTYLEGQSVITGVFLNSWNGLTLLSCFVMPAAFGEFISWMEEAARGKVQYKIEKICTAAVLLLAGQLTNVKGGFYIALMLIVTIFVMALERVRKKNYCLRGTREQ